MKSIKINCPCCRTAATDAKLHIRETSISVFFVPVASSGTTMIQCGTCNQEFAASGNPVPFEQLHLNQTHQFLVPSNNQYGMLLAIFALMTIPIGPVGVGLSVMALQANPFTGPWRLTAKIALALSAISSIVLLVFIANAVINRPHRTGIQRY